MSRLCCVTGKVHSSHRSVHPVSHTWGGFDPQSNRFRTSHIEPPWISPKFYLWIHIRHLQIQFLETKIFCSQQKLTRAQFICTQTPKCALFALITHKFCRVEEIGEATHRFNQFVQYSPDIWTSVGPFSHRSSEAFYANSQFWHGIILGISCWTHYSHLYRDFTCNSVVQTVWFEFHLKSTWFKALGYKEDSS